MDNDLDGILLALFASLPETMENFSPNEGVINLMNAILHFDCAETVTRVRSVLDAQKLVNLLDYMIHSKNALHQDAMRNAWFLAFEISARVSTVFLPCLFVGNHGPHDCTSWHDTTPIEILSQTIFAGRFLDLYIVPVLGVIKSESGVLLLNDDAHGGDLSMKQWRRRSIQSSVTIIQIMLRLAKAIQYLHSRGVVLYLQIFSHDIFLNSNLCPKIRCLCSTPQSFLAKEYQEWCSPEDNIFSFGSLFYEMYTGFVIRPENLINSRKRPSEPEIPEYAWQLIQRCCANQESRPTIDEVVNEMKGWHSVGYVEPDEAVNGVEGWHSIRQVEPDEVVNDLEGWRSDGHVEPPRQSRTCFRALGSVLSDLRRNMC
ncbi:Protein kinase-like domain containing protein [Amanita muscaria]